MVFARDDIDAGEIVYGVDCQLPGFALAEATTVDQEIGVRRQALADLLKLLGVTRAD